jgi:hypothetical protein
MSKTKDVDTVTGAVRIILRAEGAAALVIATALYFSLGGSWWLFALLFFSPDLSFLGYSAGRRTGALVYNLAHTYVVPAALGGLGLMVQSDLLQHLALIHAAHIGFDRALGYGLKYPSGFKHSHLGVLGQG